MSARDYAIALAASFSVEEGGEGMDVEEFLSRLNAAGFVVEQGWQPIETAPRDGRLLLVSIGRRAFTARWNGFDWIEGINELLREPTHWRPLPTPPEKP